MQDACKMNVEECIFYEKKIKKLTKYKQIYIKKNNNINNIYICNILTRKKNAVYFNS
jgi:hypothetical protein